MMRTICHSILNTPDVGTGAVVNLCNRSTHETYGNMYMLWLRTMPHKTTARTPHTDWHAMERRLCKVPTRTHMDHKSHKHPEHGIHSKLWKAWARTQKSHQCSKWPCSHKWNSSSHLRLVDAMPGSDHQLRELLAIEASRKGQ
mmetsp:Transcript_105470/g.183444  ORF Transcript_105470/g.183444 Transcript_105470/m.183444 type:complete len:143 (-) Transcript_105470:332-760(-)